MKLLLIALTCVLAGGVTGALMNIVNGVVSPYYFTAIMGWDFDDVWLAAVAQGIFEGILYGIIFSMIFISAFGLITRGKGGYKFAFMHLIRLMAIVLVFWAAGGLIAMFLAVLSPDFYRSHFLYVPEEKKAMIRYAWVGGSIWGGMIGGLITSMVGVVVIRNNWRHVREGVTRT